MENLIIRKPDDWHLHLREGVILRNIVRYTSEYFGRAIVMPNTKDPITSIKKSILYKKESAIFREGKFYIKKESVVFPEPCPPVKQIKYG